MNHQGARVTAAWRRWRKYPIHHLIVGALHRVTRRVRCFAERTGVPMYTRPPVFGHARSDVASRLGLPLCIPGEGVPAVAPFCLEEPDLVLARARRIAEHEFDLLGSGSTNLGPVIDWHVDFKSGYRWPMHHYSVLRRDGPPGADVKVPWELGRFHHCGPLVKAWLITGDPAWAQEICQQVMHFIAVNPPGFGVQWLSAMDVAIRAANWSYAFAVLESTRQLRPEDQDAWSNAIWHHAAYVRRNLSWNPHSRGNHYLTELVGLAHVGLLYGHAPAGRRMARSAIRRVRREIRFSVTPDGVSWEGSTNYHRLVTELFAQVDVLVRRTTVPLNLPEDPLYTEQLKKMFSVVAGYTRPDGTAPLIGDVDDGRLLGFAMAVGSSNRHLESLSMYDARRAVDASRSWPLGGLHAMRRGRSLIALRCGPVGLNGRGAHDHADQLAIDVTMDGVPIFVDPGTYVYTSDPQARAAFRSTTAHSTVTLDHRDQMEFSTETLFEVDLGATGTRTVWDDRAESIVFEGVHDGYRRLPDPVLHRRRLVLNRLGEHLEITDRLEGASAIHHVRITFQCAPEVSVDAGCGAGEIGLRVGERCFTLHFRSSTGGSLSTSLESGGVASGYGQRAVAPRIVFAGTIRVPASFHFSLSVTRGDEGLRGRHP